jgi:hypothetical protein
MFQKREVYDMTERKISDNLSSINEELAELRLRTKKYKGAPFYEYRKKRFYQQNSSTE